MPANTPPSGDRTSGAPPVYPGGCGAAVFPDARPGGQHLPALVPAGDRGGRRQISGGALPGLLPPSLRLPLRHLPGKTPPPRFPPPGRGGGTIMGAGLPPPPWRRRGPECPPPEGGGGARAVSARLPPPPPPPTPPQGGAVWGGLAPPPHVGGGPAGGGGGGPFGLYLVGHVAHLPGLLGPLAPPLGLKSALAICGKACYSCHRKVCTTECWGAGWNPAES